MEFQGVNLKYNVCNERNSTRNVLRFLWISNSKFDIYAK